MYCTEVCANSYSRPDDRFCLEGRFYVMGYDSPGDIHRGPYQLKFIQRPRVRTYGITYKFLSEQFTLVIVHNLPNLHSTS